MTAKGDPELDQLLASAMAASGIKGEASLSIAKARQRERLAIIDSARIEAQRLARASSLKRALESDGMDAQRFRWLASNLSVELADALGLSLDSIDSLRAHIDNRIISEARSRLAKMQAGDSRLRGSL